MQLFPDLVFPVLGVWAGYYPGFNVGTTPAEIEEKLTIPIENAVASLPRVKKINSWTWTNGCWTWVEMASEATCGFPPSSCRKDLKR